VRTDAPVYMRERGGWAQGGSGGGWGRIKCTIVKRSCRIRRVCIFCENVRGSFFSSWKIEFVQCVMDFIMTISFGESVIWRQPHDLFRVAETGGGII
jgi:hypothetical protein